MTDEGIEALRLLTDRVTANEAAIRSIVVASVAEGLKAAIADPATWDAFFLAFSRRAQKEAGTLAWTSIKWAIMRTLTLVVVGMFIYLLGGWSMLATFVKSAGAGSHG